MSLYESGGLESFGYWIGFPLETYVHVYGPGIASFFKDRNSMFS